MPDYTSREEIPTAYKWRLDRLFPTLTEWENTYSIIEEQIRQLAQYKNRLGEDPKTLLAYLQLDTKTRELFERVSVYARMWEDENTKDSTRQSLVQRLSPLELAYSTATASFTNEVLAITDDAWKTFYQLEELTFYQPYLEEITRYKAHILSPEKEEVLAQTSLLYSADHTFRMLDNADLSFDDIIGPNGERYPLTNSNYSVYIAHKDRTIRKQAFDHLYKGYERVQNTLASTMIGNLQKDKFYATIRQYESALDQALFDDNIPKDVYVNLIKTVHNHLPKLHEYVALRKSLLNVESLHTYDMYVDLFEQTEQTISYEDAYATMIDALGVLGEDYIALLQEAHDNGWIDVYPSEGKRNGAYSWGAYQLPFVLLNHKDDVNSLFTLAHEMGHCLHSYYSDAHLPYTYAQYCIFVAEVASTVNEVLLMRHLLQTTTDPTRKKYLISEFLDKFKSTLFRQTQFAEFELRTHDLIEQDQPLTGETMCNLYTELNQQYYGKDLAHDPAIRLEWARIPHFYNAFYVYQYATGFSAAIAIADRILTEGEPAVADYKRFLQSGGSDDPIELLKIAGVDMSSPKPIEQAMHLFADLLAELKTLTAD